MYRYFQLYLAVFVLSSCSVSKKQKCSRVYNGKNFTTYLNHLPKKRPSNYVLLRNYSRDTKDMPLSFYKKNPMAHSFSIFKFRKIHIIEMIDQNGFYYNGNRINYKEVSTFVVYLPLSTELKDLFKTFQWNDCVIIYSEASHEQEHVGGLSNIADSLTKFFIKEDSLIYKKIMTLGILTFTQGWTHIIDQ